MTVPPPLAQEEVQELFYARRNYFPPSTWPRSGSSPRPAWPSATPAAGITDRLARRHGIRVTDLPAGDQPVQAAL